MFSFFECLECQNLPKMLRKKIKDNKCEAEARILLDYPTVYIHAWKEDEKWHIYVGETYDIVRRTGEHYRKKLDLENEKDPWQQIMLDKIKSATPSERPSLYVFGSDCFNRSMTLDIEDSLIKTLSVSNTIVLHNGKHNEQGAYDNYEQRDEYFDEIWSILQRKIDDVRRCCPIKSPKPSGIAQKLSSELVCFQHNWQSSTGTEKRVEELKKAIENKYQNECEKKDLLLTYPIIYIHLYIDETKKLRVYVGEANELLNRTKDHLDSKDVDWHQEWQKILREGGAAGVIVFGHPSFNKSLTLDLENRLIDYFILLGCSCNGRTNEQNNYNNKSKMPELFRKIIDELNTISNGKLPKIEEVQKRSVFMASPFMKLTDDQEEAREKIMDTIKAKLDSQEKALLLIEGGAGTGKTVLLGSLFFSLYQMNTYDCRFIVNRDELYNLYKKQSAAWQLKAFQSKELVMKAEKFIGNTGENDPVDIAFVDEAHLLYTQGTQGKILGSQLPRIRERARVTVLVFDPLQFYEVSTYWESGTIEELQKNACRVSLKEQMRMKCASETEKWIESICKEGGKVEKLSGKLIKTDKSVALCDDNNYEVRIFNSLEDMNNAINEKKKDHLACLAATYEWPYSKEWAMFEIVGREDSDKLLCSWNETGSGDFRTSEDAADALASAHDIQGFDMDYVGVIIGWSVGYVDKKIAFFPDAHQAKDKNRTLQNGEVKCVAPELISHELYILLTRGVKGLYLYACDPCLHEALTEALQQQ